MSRSDPFFRLKGCVPEWILEDEHRFSWKVVSLLGLYGGHGGVSHVMMEQLYVDINEHWKHSVQKLCMVKYYDFNFILTCEDYEE